MELDDEKDEDDIRRLRVKVDGANITFNYGGYTKRNVKLVGRSANAAKHDMTPAEFRQFIITSYRWIKKAGL